MRITAKIPLTFLFEQRMMMVTPSCTELGYDRSLQIFEKKEEEEKKKKKKK